MFEVALTEAQRDYGWSLGGRVTGKFINQECWKRSCLPGQDRDYNQRRGYVGHTAFSDYYGFERPVFLNHNDAGFDAIYNGMRLNIKTHQDWPLGRLLLIVHDKDLRPDVDGFGCVTLDDDLTKVFFVGWISMADFRAKMVPYNDKGTKSWSVNALFLNPFKDKRTLDFYS